MSYAKSTPDSENKKAESQEAKGKRANEAPHAIGSSSPISAQPRAGQTEKEKEQKSPDPEVAHSIGVSLKHIARDSFINLLLTGALIIVAVLQLVYFVVQLHFMKIAIGDTKNLIKAVPRRYFSMVKAWFVNYIISI
jgi:hypothetical protein